MSLEIKELNKSFGNKVIFSSFNRSFPESGIFALVGESGAGKTTLLRMIAGLDTEFSGEISGGGIKNSSVAFQEYRLFPYLSAKDNLVYSVSDGKDPSAEEKAMKILAGLGFGTEDMKKYPRELSGGMKQRVSIGRAFMKDCPILLLDEPTKELDRDNVNLVLDEIKKQGEKRLVIVVTHRLEDIEYLSAELVKV